MATLSEKYKNMSKKQKNNLVAIVLLVPTVIALLVYLLGSSLTGLPSLTPKELLARSASADYKADEEIKLGGKITSGTIKVDRLKQTAEFAVHGKTPQDNGAKDIYVKYAGQSNIPPDFERKDLEVVVQGTYDKEQNIFKANNLFTKCPSKYEAQKNKKKK